MESYLNKPRLQLQELRKKIKALKRLNLRMTEIESLKANLAPILHHYVHPSPLLQPGERVFRAVPWPTRPSHKLDLGYPPANKVGYGRCNRPGEPVFYGSVDSTAAIQELATVDGQRLAVSMWRVTKPTLVASLGYSERAFTKLGSTRWPQVWWRRNLLNDPEPPAAHTRENKLIDRFLANEFTRKISNDEKWGYKLSIAIAETYLKGAPISDGEHAAISGLTDTNHTVVGVEVGGLVYPSIATNANDDNVALKCSVADTCLEFVWTHYVEVQHPNNKHDEYSPKGLDFADRLSPSGEIQWLGQFPNHLSPGSDYRIDVNGTDLVLKDSLDRIVGTFSSLTSK